MLVFKYIVAFFETQNGIFIKLVVREPGLLDAKIHAPKGGLSEG